MGNDIFYFVAIASIFIFIGAIIPFYNSEFGSSVSEVNVNLDDEISTADLEDVATPITFFNVIGSVLKMFFWTFGDLPIWLDTLFIAPRLALIFIFLRNVWIGGGG